MHTNCFKMTPFEAHVLIQQTTIPAASSSPSRRNNTTRSTCVRNTQTKLNATTSTKPTFSTSSGGTESILEEALKSHRLNPNIRFKNESLLSTTIKKSCPNLLKLFLEHGADPNLKSYENGRYEPALITAVRYKSLPCVQILLEYGANLGKTNFYGTDAIFQAVHENAFEILECLLSEYKPQQQQSFYNHRHHDRHPSSINAKDYQKRQRRQKDVPAALSSSSSESEAAALPESSSSSSTLPPPPSHQSINIQKTTTTKGKDSRGNKAVVLNREKPSNNANNNSRSSKGHEEDDDGDSNIDDDDHVLCPFYYALNYAPSYPSKRESLVRLLQSYYKCKCLEEIASCHQNNFGGDTTHIEDKEKGKQTRDCKAVAGNQAKECWNVVRSSYVNFSGWWQWWYAKSVPPAGYGAVHVGDSVQNYRTQQYHAHDHHHYQCDPIPSTSSSVDVDNENDIKFLLPAESSGKGGEGNELCSSNLFPYKIYKIQGKCHVIKENESSSTPSPVSVSSSPSPSTTPAATANTRTTRVHKRPSSSFVILVGPLKLSCITREVIRDQIKLCGSRGTRKIKRSSKNIIQTTTSASANGTTREQHNEGSQRSGESTVASEPLELWLKSEDYFNRMNFRKSLETLMMPSSLMDYILYKNIHWSESRSCSTLLSSSGIRMLRRRDENEYTTAAAADENSSAAADDNVGENNELSNNIKLIKRDLELNINYFAIYIY